MARRSRLERSRAREKIYLAGDGCVLWIKALTMTKTNTDSYAEGDS